MWFQRLFLLLPCLLLLLCALTARANEEYNVCCLCDDCDFVAPGRDDFNVDQFGTTCYDLLLDMADDQTESQPGNGKCRSLQARHRQTCCDASYNPPEVAQVPTPAPVINLPYGDEPLCDVCKDGRYPGIPTTVLAILYIPGNPTCGQLYEMGKRGLILDRLCKPIQKYLFEDCGCNLDTAVTEEANVGRAPILQDLTTEAPVNAPTNAPTNSPTLAPVIQAVSLASANAIPTAGVFTSLGNPTGYSQVTAAADFGSIDFGVQGNAAVANGFPSSVGVTNAIVPPGTQASSTPVILTGFPTDIGGNGSVDIFGTSTNDLTSEYTFVSSSSEDTPASESTTTTPPAVPEEPSFGFSASANQAVDLTSETSVTAPDRLSSALRAVP